LQVEDGPGGIFALMQIYKTKKEQEPPITEITSVIGENTWIRLFEPSEDELAIIAEKCAIPHVNF
jgi:hypothetical protein